MEENDFDRLVKIPLEELGMEIASKLDGLNSDNRDKLVDLFAALHLSSVVVDCLITADEHKDHEDCDLSTPEGYIKGYTDLMVRDLIQNVKTNCALNGVEYSNKTGHNEALANEILTELENEDGD